MFSSLEKIWAGQTLLRVLMNCGLRSETIRGVVIDIGGGRTPDYFTYLKREQVTSITPIDASISRIDFEQDPLPFADSHADTVMCVNVLEHIYHHQFLLGEMRRILRPGGALIGFVPFLIQYHPDPHDYFRYTREALEKLLAETGFTEVRVRTVGGGPFAANFNNIVLSVPRIARVSLFPFYYGLDRLMLWLRPGVRERYPLGYLFTARHS